MPRYYRKVIRITAEDSPNVKWARTEQAHGLQPTNTIQIPGVLPWDLYEQRRALWPEIRQKIGLDAQFWEGAEFLLFPPQWLERAERFAATRPAFQATKWLGVDSGEGGDKTAWAVVDRLGLIELIARPTPDTMEVVAVTKALIRKYNLEGERVMFDRGGGGKQHADRLRAEGYEVRTVAFGEPPVADLRRGLTPLEEKRNVREEKSAYKNRRAEMYGTVSDLLDPTLNEVGWGIPECYRELHRQLGLIPKKYDNEGRIFLPPKNQAPALVGQPKVITLRSMLGCSPDEADALVIAVECMTARTVKIKVVVG